MCVNLNPRQDMQYLGSLWQRPESLTLRILQNVELIKKTLDFANMISLEIGKGERELSFIWWSVKKRYQAVHTVADSDKVGMNCFAHALRGINF